LSDAQMKQFLEHANACLPCRSEYEAEASTKRLVTMRARMVDTPASVRQAILTRLDHEAATPPAPPSRPWFSRLAESVRVRPSLAFALGSLALLIVVAQILQPPARVAIAGGNNVLLQSMENYKAVMDGSITPQVASSDPASVLKLFEGATTFPVHVPKLRNCTLVGGVLNAYQGIPLAHVVYRHGEQLIYMYQACWNTVQEGKSLMVPDEVKDSLRKTGWYTASLEDGRTMALWVRGRTLCAAVAEVERDELVACLTAEDTAPVPAY
jgi:anti-sigma factor RsiW